MDVRAVIIFIGCSYAVCIVIFRRGSPSCSFQQYVGIFLPPQNVERVLGTVSTLFLYIYLSYFSIQPVYGGDAGIVLISNIMEKKMNNEELQSRREFFKKAVKGVLPVLGVVVLGPSILSSCDTTPNKPTSSCGSSCKALCRNTCSLTCAASCNQGCKSNCARSSRYSQLLNKELAYGN